MKQIVLTGLYLRIFFYVAKAQISTDEIPYSWSKGIDEAVKQSALAVTLPNPVDDVLFVDLDAFASDNPALSSSARPTYDVRLYDVMGNMLRQERAGGGTVRFDVSILPDGIYYLHIYDGVNSAPEIQKIIVLH